MTDLRHARLVVSRDALLTLPEAARLLGGRDARDWIEAHVPKRYAPRGRSVVWGDVLDALHTDKRQAERQPAVRLRRAEV